MSAFFFALLDSFPVCLRSQRVQRSISNRWTPHVHSTQLLWYTSPYFHYLVKCTSFFVYKRTYEGCGQASKSAATTDISLFRYLRGKWPHLVSGVHQWFDRGESWWLSCLWWATSSPSSSSVIAILLSPLLLVPSKLVCSTLGFWWPLHSHTSDLMSFIRLWVNLYFRYINYMILYF